MAGTLDSSEIHICGCDEIGKEGERERLHSARDDIITFVLHGMIYVMTSRPRASRQIIRNKLVPLARRASTSTCLHR